MKIIVASTIALAAIAATPSTAATLVDSRAVFDALGSGTNYTYDLNSVANDLARPFTPSSTRVSPAFAYSSTSTTTVDGSRFLLVQLSKTAQPTSSFVITSTTPFQSIGFDIKPYGAAPGASNDYGEGVIFTGSTGETGQFFTPSTVAAAGSPAFQGIVFDAPVTSVSFTAFGAGSAPGAVGTDNATLFGTDNYTFYTSRLVAAAPEPGAWAMMIAGFGVAGGALRRRRRGFAIA